MNFIATALLAVFCVFQINAQQFKISLKNAVSHSDPEYVKIKTTVREEGGINVLDIDSDVIKAMDFDGYAQLIAYTINSKNESSILIEGNKNGLCDFFEHPEIDPILKLFFENIQKFGTVPNKCPAKLGHYSVKGFIMDPNILPKFTPTGYYRIVIHTLKKVGETYTPVYAIEAFADVS